MQLCTGATTCTYYHGAGTAGTMVGTVESVSYLPRGYGTGTLSYAHLYHSGAGC